MVADPSESLVEVEAASVNPPDSFVEVEIDVASAEHSVVTHSTGTGAVDVKVGQCKQDVETATHDDVKVRVRDGASTISAAAAPDQAPSYKEAMSCDGCRALNRTDQCCGATCDAARNADGFCVCHVD